MRRWAALFFISAIVTGAIGFRSDGSWLTEVCHIMSYVFLVGFLVMIVSDFFRGGAR